MATIDSANVSPGYRALVEAAGLVDLSGRTQLEFTGRDRAVFLHNFCTNNVRSLPTGSGAEAFILDAKGHVLGHVYLFVGPSSIILDSAAGEREPLIRHLERYIIREDVTISDRTDEWSCGLVAGPRAAPLLESLAIAVPQEPLAHGAAMLLGRAVYIRRVELVGADSFLLAFDRGESRDVMAALANAGAVSADFDAFEMARVEAGTPIYGPDITQKNLPQEVNRDARAISFTKGCYLGQETVARIDALGHVNRVLIGVRFASGAHPGPGQELLAAEESSAAPAVVGAVTSAVYSPRLQAPLALAYVRRSHTRPGTRLNSSAGPAEVIALPL